MKKLIIVTLSIAALLSLTGCFKKTSAETITPAQAKEAVIALIDPKSEATIIKEVEFKRDNNIDYYKVEVNVKGQDYEVYVDAVTGSIIENKVPLENLLDNAPITDTQVNTDTTVNEETYDIPTDSPVINPTPTPQPAPTTNNKIGEAKAKEIALKHAGVSENQISYYYYEMDYENRKEVYDLSFYVGTSEYDYDIDAYTGEIISYDYEIKDSKHQKPQTNPQQLANTITDIDAKNIALSQVPGATAADIKEFEVDSDDGKLQYEGKIYYNGVEYEFEIDGYSGAIREWDVDYDD